MSTATEGPAYQVFFFYCLGGMKLNHEIIDFGIDSLQCELSTFAGGTLRAPCNFMSQKDVLKKGNECFPITYT